MFRSQAMLQPSRNKSKNHRFFMPLRNVALCKLLLLPAADALRNTVVADGAASLMENVATPTWKGHR